MGKTGIIRRVDDLGKIVIPREIREKAGIMEGTLMEIFIDSDEIVLKKYNIAEDLMNIVSVLSEAVDNSVNDLEAEKMLTIRNHIKAIINILK